MPKLSIIVPVYNVEKYIEKCLQSLTNQTMKDYEIILVNDGTKDNSEEVIRNYINCHKEIDIKYFKKENGGLASARNYGVKQATGKYLSFIDPDDYIDEHLYQNLEQYMDDEIDVIKFKMKTVDESGNIIENLDGPIFETCTGEEGYQKLCGKENFLDPACIYLYRREFFLENQFEYRLTYHEDFGLTSLILVKAKSLVSTNIYGYFYLQTTNSLTRSKESEKNIARAKDMLAHYDYMIQKIENYPVQKQTKELIRRYYTNSVILKAEELRGQTEEFRKYRKEIQKRKLYRNIKPYNVKQLIKRILLKININLYLKMR